MRVWIICCSLILINVSVFGQAKVHDAVWIKSENIKSITYFSQAFTQRHGAILLEKKFLYEKDNYDKDGILSAHEEDNLEGRVSWEYTRALDTTDTEYGVTIGSAHGRFSRYVYNKENRLLRIESDTIINKVRLFTYNEDGLIASEIGVVKYLTIISKDSTAFIYNVHGQIMESRFYLKGILESRKLYRYNEEHLIAKVISYTGKKKNRKSIQRSRIYEYYN